MKRPFKSLFTFSGMGTGTRSRSRKSNSSYLKDLYEGQTLLKKSIFGLCCHDTSGRICSLH